MAILSSFRLIYIVGAANALFFSLLLFSKRDKSLADKILGWWLVVLFLQLAIPALYLTNLNLNYRYAGIEIVLYVFHPLFLYLYVKAMLGRLTKPVTLLWNLPVVIFYEVYCSYFFTYPAKDRLLFVEGKEFLPAIYLVSMLVVIVAYFVWNIYASYQLLKDYKDNVLQVYSYRENVDLLWLRRMIVLFALISLLVFPLGLISYFGFHSMVFADYFFFITLVVFIFFLGFWGYQQGAIFNIANARNEENAEPKEADTSGQHVLEKHYRKEALHLDEMMKSEKIYLDPSLTIHDLAAGMDMPAHQLSKVINTEFHCNFFEYINRFRVEEFKQMACSSEYQNRTILAIALDCGFNSKSAFNRIFKDVTGLTPREYILHRKS
ncbi:MAG: helix-turn-helix domain-containing protein [Paludibacter sp.]|nr:helix-turn-helix domain-containing protein [Paludibacter sp.]